MLACSTNAIQPELPHPVMTGSHTQGSQCMDELVHWVPYTACFAVMKIADKQQGTLQETAALT